MIIILETPLGFIDISTDRPTSCSHADIESGRINDGNTDAWDEETMVLITTNGKVIVVFLCMYNCTYIHFISYLSRTY